MAEWTRAYINDLPDAAFAIILPGGEKDEGGKTTPRDLRKLPHHGPGVKDGSEHTSVDRAHLNNALQRLPQSDLSEEQKSRARSHLEKHRDALKESETEFKEVIAIQLLEAADKKGKVWDVIVIEEGFSKNGVVGPDGKEYQRYYPREAILQLFEKLKEKTIKAFTYGVKPDDIDHLPAGAKNMQPFGFVDNQVGWFGDFKIVENLVDGISRAAVAAKFYFDERASQLRAAVKDAWDKGIKDYVGFSIDALGTSTLGRAEGQLAEIVTAVKGADSVDLVSDAAAGGRFVRLAASVGVNVQEDDVDKLKELIIKLVEAIAPDSLKDKDREGIEGAEAITIFAEAVKNLNEAVFAERILKSRLSEAARLIESEDYEGAGAIFTEILEGKSAKTKEIQNQLKDKDRGDPGQQQDATKNKGGDGDADVVQVQESLKQLQTSYGSLERRFKEADCRIHLDEQLAKSKLPKLTQDKIREQFAGKIYEQIELQESLKREREYLGKLSGTGRVEVPGQDIKLRESEQDKLTLALTGFFLNEDQKGSDDKAVPRFRSFKEAFSAATGKPTDTPARAILRESSMWIPPSMKKENPELSRFLESLTTSSWTQILGDSVTRAMAHEYSESPLQSWRLVCSDINPIKDFRTQRRMLVGGYGDLPTVGQGGVYQPLTSPTDAENTYVISKRGGTEDLTEEMVANDDVGAIRRIPQRMSRAAIRTLYKAVWNLFSANTATCHDGNVIFSASPHGNLLTDPLTSLALSTVRSAMRTQTPYGTADEPLGPVNVPVLLAVPNELEALAERLCTSEKFVNTADYWDTSGAGPAAEASTTPNPHRGMKWTVIDHWTDPTDWFAFADPKEVPMVEVGFYNGQEEPELWVQNMPNVGSTFDRDVITYKLRHVWGLMVEDWVGMHRNTVAG